MTEHYPMWYHVVMLDNRIQKKLLEFTKEVNKLHVISDNLVYGQELTKLVKLYAEEIQDIDKELPAELVNERFGV